MIQGDVWGPFRVINNLGSKWFVTFINDQTNIIWMFLMKEKSEMGKIFQKFNLMIQTQLNAKIQVLRTNNICEYPHSNLGPYLLEQGIIH